VIAAAVVRCLSAGMIIAVLGGCQSTRPYPICFFDKQPDAAELKRFQQGWASDVRIYLGEKAAVSFTHDARWVVATGRPADHDALTKVWPRLGCVGHYESELSYPAYSGCLTLLQQMLVVPDYLTRGEHSEMLGMCGYCNGSAPFFATASEGIANPTAMIVKRSGSCLD
jgi:hypothetical protein